MVNVALMRALLPYPALRQSVALFRKRRGQTFGLGVALVTSLGAVFCGLGVVATPWFLCELFALQIALGTGGPYPVKRTPSWFAAGAVQVVAVGVLATISALALLALGPDVLLGGISLGAPTGAEPPLMRFAVLMLVSGLVIALSMYFEHAPAILIDRGGGLHAALLESARLVAETGPFRTWLTSLAAHSLQMGPGLVSIYLAASHASLEVSLRWAIVLFPVVAVSLALGQGMMVASYLHLRDGVTLPEAVPSEAAPSKSGAFVWSLLLMGVMSGPLLALLALARPALPAIGQLPRDARIVLSMLAKPEPQQRYLPESAVQLVLETHSVAITASDGGGVGTLPLPPGPIAEVRAARPRSLSDELRSSAQTDSTFALEVHMQDGTILTSYIDEAGIRLDDSLHRRLRARLPVWAPLALCACLLWTALWIAYALPPQARIRQKLAETKAHHCESKDLTQLKSALRRRALLAALWLLPATVCSLLLGLQAALS